MEVTSTEHKILSPRGCLSSYRTYLFRHRGINKRRRSGRYLVESLNVIKLRQYIYI